MKTRCHFWFEDGTADFEYGPLYEDIPDNLIEEYKYAEAAFHLARNKLADAVMGMTPIKTNRECCNEIMDSEDEED